MYSHFAADEGDRPNWRGPQQAGAGYEQAEGLASVVGLCASAEYQLAATEGWGPQALDMLRLTCIRIGTLIRKQGIAVQAPPAPPLHTIHGVVARCVALNTFIMQIRRRCQNQLDAWRQAHGDAHNAKSASRVTSTASANHRWFCPEPMQAARPPLGAADLQALQLAFRRIRRLLAHSGAERADGAALASRVQQVLADIDEGQLDCNQLWGVLGQAQRTLAELGPRAETLAQAFAQVTHIVGHAHLRQDAMAR